MIDLNDRTQYFLTGLEADTLLSPAITVRVTDISPACDTVTGKVMGVGRTDAFNRLCEKPTMKAGDHVVITLGEPGFDHYRLQLERARLNMKVAQL